MSGITLHPEKGLNPYLTYCPRCKGDGPEIMLIGNRDTVYECDRCKMKLIGTSICPEHGNVGIEVRKLRDGEKLPGSLCNACEKEVEEFKRVVAEGGVYWKCDTCGCGGAIRASSEVAVQAREITKIPAPDPCGIDFTGQSNCPGCNPPTGESDESSDRESTEEEAAGEPKGKEGEGRDDPEDSG